MSTAVELPPPPPIGWRDDPVEDDPCVDCHGWGVRENWHRIAAPETRDGHGLETRGLVTCPRCRGTGRRRLV